MTKVKDINNNIISGTEVAYQKKATKKHIDHTKKQLDEKFQKKWKDHKDHYMAKHSTKDMVYENGSALALLYREVQRLNQLLTTNLQSDEK